MKHRQRGVHVAMHPHPGAHDVIVMKDGDILEAGSAAQVLDAPQNDYTRTLVAAAS